jgi:hypothetical protein
MTDDNKIDPVEMLQYIRFGHKYKDKKGSFIFIPMDVTLRDQEGNYMGTAYHLIIHLIGTFNSVGAPGVQKVDQRLALDYVYHQMYHYDEKNKL